MWIKKHTKEYSNVSVEAIWNLWIDINNWHKWNPGVEYCELHGPFAVGSHFTLKSKGGPEVKIELVEVEKHKKFTDCTTFPGAKMYGMHEIEQVGDDVRLTTTMKVEGPLKWLWIFLVARKIVAKNTQQTENLVELARAR